MESKKFKGNWPQNIARDAKYTVRTGNNGPVVGVIFSAGDGVSWFASSEEHEELVKMVNNIKLSVTGFMNGSFYINEYHQVIVPVKEGSTSVYYLAGKYYKPLHFNFEGNIISGDAVDLQGNPLTPGDEWLGPHPGIPYVLTAANNDIYYKYSPRPNVTKKVLLSKKIGKEAAEKLARRIGIIKGPGGGRFYVNEFRHIFAPISGNFIEYKYIGKLDLDEWFPEVN
jgi:hypothetical protein